VSWETGETEMTSGAELIAKSLITEAVKKGARYCLERYVEQQERRVQQMLSVLGEELAWGETTEAWDEFLERIDDEKIHAAVVDAARRAIDSFDEAPIPYIAKVVALFKAAGTVTIDDRRLIRLLAECDHHMIDTLKHLVGKLQETCNTANQLQDMFKLRLIPAYDQNHLVVATVGQTQRMQQWQQDGHDYQTLFPILKQNYWATESTAGQAGSESGPHIVLLPRKKFDRLAQIML